MTDDVTRPVWWAVAYHDSGTGKQVSIRMTDTRTSTKAEALRQTFGRGTVSNFVFHDLGTTLAEARRRMRNGNL